MVLIHVRPEPVVSALPPPAGQMQSQFESGTAGEFWCRMAHRTCT